ncbi:MAG TPA: hypothetical protein VFW50_44670 [Streptosporangiaceae bacterium]|nr:hypothetical protein [Streptosporangiaceae bacterium]
MRAVTAQGRLAWAVSGLAAAAALAIPGTYLITTAGVPGSGDMFGRPQNVYIRTLSVSQPVTSLTVDDFGGQVRVKAGPVRRVQITERISYDQADSPPPVAESVAGGRLTLRDPACGNTDCDVDFTVTVPSSVSVTVATQGGPAVVSGVARASVDSAGGPAGIADIAGPLTVSTGGSPLTINRVAGPLRVGTEGGMLSARGITASTASVDTGGGPAQIVFSAVPRAVQVGTEGVPVIVRVPGGPYALTADSDGGPEIIGIATDPAARLSLRITSGGGPLQVAPAAGTGGIQPPAPPSVVG